MQRKEEFVSIMDFYRFFVDVGYYVLYSLCNNRLFGYLEYWKNFGLKYVK